MGKSESYPEFHPKVDMRQHLYHKKMTLSQSYIGVLFWPVEQLDLDSLGPGLMLSYDVERRWEESNNRDLFNLGCNGNEHTSRY
jgi:hypothetical protein